MDLERDKEKVKEIYYGISPGRKTRARRRGIISESVSTPRALLGVQDTGVVYASRLLLLKHLSLH
jgi:hypothetical protein